MRPKAPACVAESCVSRFPANEECGLLGGCAARSVLVSIGKAESRHPGELPETYPDSGGGRNIFIEALATAGLARKVGGERSTSARLTERGKELANGT